MKRDMDLVREILLAVEAAPSPLKDGLRKMDGHAPEFVVFHVRLLKEAGFLEEPFTRHTTKGEITHGVGLTWQGYEFLETIRDPAIWSATKANAKAVGSWSLGLLGELAKGLIKQKAAELGFPLA